MNTIDRLRAQRQAARAEAENALRALNFASTDRGWVGTLELSTLQIDLTIVLRDEFPDVLPELFVDLAQLPFQLPHIEATGKVCIAPPSAVLIDVSRPRSVIENAIEVARKTLEDGISGRNEQDFHREFLAYWDMCRPIPVTSICDPMRPFRQLCAFRLHRRLPGGSQTLLADSREQATKWLRHLGIRAKPSGATAAFVPLHSAFSPPEPSEIISVRTLRDLVRTHADPGVVHAFEGWLDAHPPPLLLVLSLPAATSPDRILIGLGIGPPPRRAESFTKGFRPNRVPVRQLLSLMADEPTQRASIARLDAEFLLKRGGSEPRRSGQSRLAVIGAGSIGSFVAEKLALCGFNLLLIDGDILEPANAHRHLLGLGQWGVPKASGVATVLSQRFPHLDFQARDVMLEKALSDEPDLLSEALLIVFATGDHTFELRMNQLLAASAPRVHTWIEPLGIGGHALSCGKPGRRGCMRCLYRPDPTHGLVNRASFLAPGQQVEANAAGCSGTFSPFSALDSAHTAELAARLVLLATENAGEPMCVSWLGDVGFASRRGYQVSRRASTFQAWETKWDESFPRVNCPDCRDW